MASFADAPAGDAAVGEKIFKTKCAQVSKHKRTAGYRSMTATPSYRGCGRGV